MKKPLLITLTVLLALIGTSYISITVHDWVTPKSVSVYQSVPSKTPVTKDNLLEAINAERAKVGVEHLEWDKNVEMSAQLKANDMAAKGYFAHIIPGTNGTITPEMAEYVNKSCTSSSENIFWDKRGSTVEGAIGWWMKSEPHRKAIQDPKYTKTGFGIADNKIVERFCVE